MKIQKRQFADEDPTRNLMQDNTIRILHAYDVESGKECRVSKEYDQIAMMAHNNICVKYLQIFFLHPMFNLLN